ncbi:MAG: T9SS type A sorting domain-containing protein [Bacteroidota bacterium]|jgi:hypothetical protein
MKKIFTLAFSLGIAAISFGQTQRMVLTEEFTNASCGPCAGQNPAYNALLQANSSKIVALKYQVNFPGADPMNAQTQSEVAPRQTYYGVNGVPYAPINGDTLPLTDWAGTGYTGGPYHYTQEIIDSAYASPAPFSLNLSHTLSANLDSIFITAVVTAAQDLTGLANPKLRLAIVEKTITFSSAPGSNGETEFFDVMRKMVPNATGQTLVANWTNAQTQTFTYAVKLPTFIYNLLEVGVVGFIQTDGNKVVHQAAISNPVSIANYASIPSVNSDALTCVNNIAPSITIKNEGSANLTACNIAYSLNGGPEQTQPFTGNLATGATQSVTLNSIANLTAGANNISYRLTAINGSAVSSPVTSKVVNLVGNATLLNNYSEDFAAATNFNTLMLKISDDATGWSRSTTAGNGTIKGSAKMDFYNSPVGKVDDLILPPFDLTGLADPKLTFEIAHAQYLYTSGATTNDTMEVWHSTDCGASWTLDYRKSGDVLATATAQSAAYTATIAAQFRKDSVNLVGAANKAKVLVMFRARSDYGNNAYVDNINITSGFVGLNEVSKNNNISLYPNPAQNNLSVVIENVQANGNISIVDAIGKSVYSTALEGKGKVFTNIDLTNISNGIYFVRVNSGNSVSVQKLIVKH